MDILGCQSLLFNEPLSDFYGSIQKDTIGVKGQYHKILIGVKEINSNFYGKRHCIFKMWHKNQDPVGVEI